MTRRVSVRELRNETAQVVSLVRAGEKVELTVNRQPVADIVPHVAERSPWVSAETVRRLVDEAPADPRLLDDLADVREDVVE